MMAAQPQAPSRSAGSTGNIYYVGHVPQLFDLGADPDELDDLAISAPDRPDVKNALDEGERRLRTVCDPEEVNQRCFADQTAKIEGWG